MMTPDLLALCVFAALLELDTTYAFQLTLSRGIIAGPLIALVTGNWMAGVQVGVFTELLFADISPLGSVLPPSATVCCAVSLALNAMGIELCFAFIAGVLCSMAFAALEKRMRKTRIKAQVFWERKITKKPVEINNAVTVSLVSAFLMNFILISCFVWVSGALLKALMPFVSMQAQTACRFAYMAVPWIGLATMIPEFRFKTR